MKKITLKISVFLLLTMCVLQVQAQALWTENGTYKISTSGPTALPNPELYMTINGATGDLEWAEELPGDDETQLWTVTGHRYAAAEHDSGNGASYMEVTATITGVGTFTMATNSVATDGNNITIIARPGEPMDNTADLSDLSGLDQFQRRKTKVDANGNYSSTGSTPSGGNNALFLKTPWSNGARFGVVPAAAGDPVQFNGSAPQPLQFHFVSALSAEKFDTSSIFVSNPVNEQLSIKGLPSNINKVSLYSLLGSEVITKKLDAQSSLAIDVSALTSGMYIVKMISDNGSFSKKIIKQ
ncbi:T9SS type A sorting domain-containing protein [Algibacter sp. PT7-4]|uniref:T9SS type A sorting domain-containing protein n=1 Tax=Algibacter ulvanivorans TaxID=3400999 RepID=UPI003AB0D5C3